jgi:putative Ca2+/H+ antiporter (TMEM165/GDT1 family)
MNWAPLITSFALVILAEIGDKTQIAVMTLSSRFKALYVFMGAMLAFLLTTGIAVVIGDVLTLMVPTFWIRIIAAIIFLVFGSYTLIVRKDETQVQTRESRNAVFSSFSLVALMELGDKTQFAVIALSAEHKLPLLVFLGVMLAFALISGVSVVAGVALTRFVPLKYIKLGSGFLFIFFGLVFLFNAVLG